MQVRSLRRVSYLLEVTFAQKTADMFFSSFYFAVLSIGRYYLSLKMEKVHQGIAGCKSGSS